MWFVFAFLLGNVVFHQCSDLPGQAWLWGSGLLCLTIVSKTPGLRFTGFFALGFCLTCFFATLRIADIKQFNGGDFKLQLEITSIPASKNFYTRFHAKVLSLGLKVPQNLRLNLYEKHTPLKLGDRINAQLHLKPLHSLSNPGTFDYAQYLFAQNIGATGYVRSWTRIDNVKPGWYQQLRQTMYDNLYQKIKHLENKGAILALTFGERAHMHAQQWQALTASGVGHLFAISGLHITLVYGFAYCLFAFLWRYFFLHRFYLATPLFASAAALPWALLYSALAGFSIPTQRALIMLGCFTVSRWLLQQTTLAQTFTVALFLVLLWDPFATLTTSFWFSFLAVLGIVIFLDVTKTNHSWIRSFGLITCLPVILMPVGLWFFQQASFIAPLANIVAIPYASFLVIPCALLAAVWASLMPELADFWVAGADLLLKGFWFVAEWIENTPGTQWFNTPSLWMHALALIGMSCILLTQRWSVRLLGGILVSILFLPQLPTIPASAFTTTFLDVGQGSAAVVQTRHHTLLFDAGARYRSGFDLGAQVVVPFLRDQGIRQIDALILSHSDNDHVGGAETVLKFYPVKHKYIGGKKQSHWLQQGFQVCQRGASWVWDKIHFRFLHPDSPEVEYGSNNDASCVLKIDNGAHQVLLTGDIEQAAERELLKNLPKQLKADVMSAPHHGSLTSSSTAFIQAVRPQIAVVSSGFRNRFQFPAAEVMKRYQNACVTVYNTAETGAIQVFFPPQTSHPLSSDRPHMNVTLNRLLERHYWQSATTSSAAAKRLGHLPEPHCSLNRSE